MEARLRTLETPAGEALSNTVAKFTALVANIQAQLDAWVAGRWTNAQIEARIGAPPDNVAIGGTLRVPDAVTSNISGMRHAVDIEDATGRTGYAPSTGASKVDIRPLELDLAGLLAIEPRVYRYRDEVAKRAEDPDYPVRNEVGLIAEEVEKAAPWAVTRDVDGKPDGVDYAALVPALLAVNRDQGRRIAAIERSLRELKAFRPRRTFRVRLPVARSDRHEPPRSSRAGAASACPKVSRDRPSDASSP